MITDLNMPGLDGFKLSRNALGHYPEMPVLMITGSIDADIPQQAEKAGIATVFPKSFKSQELIDKIKQLVKSP